MQRIKRSWGASRLGAALAALRLRWGFVFTAALALQIAATEVASQAAPNELCIASLQICCPLIHEEDDRAFYYCADSDQSQSDAVLACEAAGGRLAKVTSPTINAAVTQDRGIWVDGNDIEIEGEWRYSDYTLIEFFNWGPNEPNGDGNRDCIQILPAGTMHDFRCNNQLPYVCESDRTAVTEACGNGILEGDEQCDDGNLSNGDECTSLCKVGRCGDSVVQPGEGCDDGNTDETDGCTSACEVTPCGNGVVEGGEECDDGNADNNDSCTNFCAQARCGDGFPQPGEECDNGSRDGDDSCTAECTLPRNELNQPDRVPGCGAAATTDARGREAGTALALLVLAASVRLRRARVGRDRR